VYWMCETAERIVMEIGVATPSNAVGSVSFSYSALLIWLRVGTGGGHL